MSHVAPTAPGAPIESGGLLRRVAGDYRSALSGLSAGIMQLMWPHLGRGVEDHSAFFEEPWDRIYRSVPQIWATILADDADDEGRRIRDLHRDIKGVDAHGERYHALDPETFWWAHATFTWEFFQVHDRWSHRSLRRREKEALYQQTVTWYRRYGVSDRPVPPDYRSFRARFDEICRDELELTPTAAQAISLAQASKVPQGLSREEVLNSAVNRILAIGCLPPVVRKRFDIEWTALDQARLDALTLTVRNASVVIPPVLVRSRFLQAVDQMATLARPHPTELAG